ncbi:MAG TPA: hypothetical protein VE991_11880 [Acidimicrobiales bacterium]|nr:hypothetical protein [Acidimicrobiales bacterium]
MALVTWLSGVAVAAPYGLGPVVDHHAVDLEIVAGARCPVPEDAPPGRLLAERVVDDRPLYRAATVDDQVVLRLHGLCDFVAEPGGTCFECRADPDAPDEVLGLVVRGALLAFHLALLGEAALHAAAVEVDGTAILFVGDSGQGKSTLAALACASDYRLVADDLVRVGAGTPPQWIGGTHELRLRPGAARMLDTAGVQWPTRLSVDERTTVRPPSTSCARGPVGAVVVPRLVPGDGDVEVRRLEPLEATLLLSAFPRLAGVRLESAAEAQLNAVSSLAESVPVVLATVPLSRATVKDVAALLEQVLTTPPAAP